MALLLPLGLTIKAITMNKEKYASVATNVVHNILNREGKVESKAGVGNLRATTPDESKAGVGKLRATTPDLSIGDNVFWSKSDDDVPEGLVGQIVLEKSNGRFRVRFPNGKEFNFKPDELEKAT